MKRFSDFSNEQILDGDKIKISKVLNQEIAVLDHSIKDSKYSKNKSGKYLTLQIKHNDEKRVIFTGSDVLIDQIEKYGDKVPFLTTIRKVNRYFSFT